MPSTERVMPCPPRGGAASRALMMRTRNGRVTRNGSHLRDELEMWSERGLCHRLGFGEFDTHQPVHHGDEVLHLRVRHEGPVRIRPIEVGGLVAAPAVVDNADALAGGRTRHKGITATRTLAL